MTFPESIQHNIRNALTFRGRDPRSSFWWYLLFVYAGSVVATMIDMALFLANPASLAFISAEPTSPEEVAALFENFISFGFYFSIVPVTLIWYAINLLPLIACGVRRMQDRDRSAWWFLLACAGIVVTTVLGMQVVSQMFVDFPLATTSAPPPDFVDDTLRTMRNMMLIWSAQTLIMILIIIWMASRGTVGPNRFGEDPLR